MSTEMSDIEFIHKLPKVELHAHINGSVSQETINKLIESKANEVPESKLQEWKTNTHILKGEKRSLDECFSMFRVIHELVDSAEAVRQMTKDVVTEFANDNVKYLELRTTPRALPGGLPRSSYVSAVLQGLEDADQAGLDITVRLLLAIDRGQHSAKDAADIVDLADNFRRESAGRVVGIDLSGNPEREDGRTYLPALEDARRRGLKLALHIAEVGGQNEESVALLDLPPDRLGHGTYLRPEKGGNDTIMGLMEKHKVPIEACLTSNVTLQTVADYSDHHFGFWNKQKHPCILCTDDKGVFNTTLSEEYEQAQKAFGLSQEQLWQVSYDAIEHIFESEQVKEELRSKWKAWKESLAS